MVDEDHGEENKRTGRERRVESLGWITESSVMPKKQRAIEGVGASSIVELRAELYKTQEDVKRSKDGDVDFEVKKSRKRNITDVFSRKNTGVDERAKRDKLQLKAVNEGSENYAALEKKAELYEQLVRGEVPDEEAKEKYSVDFLRKGFLEDEFQEMKRERTGTASQQGNLQPSSSEEKRVGVAFVGDVSTGSNTEHKQFVKEVSAETNEARGKALLLKQKRQQLAEKNRQKLRHAYLKKQVEKLKAKADNACNA